MTLCETVTSVGNKTKILKYDLKQKITVKHLTSDVLISIDAYCAELRAMIIPQIQQKTVIA